MSNKRIRVCTVSRFDLLMPVQLRRLVMEFETFPETAVRLLVSKQWKRDRDHAPRYDTLLQVHRAAVIPRLLGHLYPLELEHWVAERHHESRIEVAQLSVARQMELATAELDDVDFASLVRHVVAVRGTDTLQRVKDSLYVGRRMHAKLWVPTTYVEEKKRQVASHYRTCPMKLQVSAVRGATIEVTVLATAVAPGHLLVHKDVAPEPWFVYVSDMRTFTLRRLPRATTWRAKVKKTS